MPNVQARDTQSTAPSREASAAAPKVPTLQPSVDVYEAEGDYLVVVDLPGVSEKDLDLTLDKSELTLHASASWGGTSLQYGRSFSLPSLVDSDKLDASLNAGVLTLRLPKRPDAKPRKIAIGTA